MIPALGVFKVRWHPDPTSNGCYGEEPAAKQIRRMAELRKRLDRDRFVLVGMDEAWFLCFATDPNRKPRRRRARS